MFSAEKLLFSSADHCLPSATETFVSQLLELQESYEAILRFLHGSHSNSFELD